MLIQKFTKGNKILELHREVGVEVDDDGRRVENEYWECRYNDGRQPLHFTSVQLAVIYIQQNLWTVTEIEG